MRKAPKSLMHRNINSVILESVRGRFGTTTKSARLSFLISCFFLRKIPMRKQFLSVLSLQDGDQNKHLSLEGDVFPVIYLFRKIALQRTSVKSPVVFSLPVSAQPGDMHAAANCS